MSAAFTPGPWEESLDCGGLEVCMMHGLTRRPTEDGLGQNYISIRRQGMRFHVAEAEEKDANARLICNAPELHAELSRIHVGTTITTEQFNRIQRLLDRIAGVDA